MSETGETGEVVLSCACPCGRQVFVTQGGPKIPPAVIHSMPPCEDFEKRDALAYLIWLRRSIERQNRENMS